MAVAPSGPVGHPPAAGPTAQLVADASPPAMLCPPLPHCCWSAWLLPEHPPLPPLTSATHNFHRRRVTSWGCLPARPAQLSLRCRRRRRASHPPGTPHFPSPSVLVGAGEPTTPLICLFVIFTHDHHKIVSLIDWSCGWPPCRDT